MTTRDEFLKKQRVLRLATTDGRRSAVPHIVPVWYRYSGRKFYIGTSIKSQKVKNIMKNKHVSCCVDARTTVPGIYGVMVQGVANLIVKSPKTRTITKKILSKYFKNMETKSIKKALDNSNCVIEIIPRKFFVWKF